jgi:hypothetical protein
MRRRIARRVPDVSPASLPFPNFFATYLSKDNSWIENGVIVANRSANVETPAHEITSGQQRVIV